MSGSLSISADILVSNFLYQKYRCGCTIFYNLNLASTYSGENKASTILFGLVEDLNPSLIIWQQKKDDMSSAKRGKNMDHI